MTGERRRVAANHRTGLRYGPCLSEQIRGEDRPEVARTAWKLGTLDGDGIRGVDVDRIGVVVGQRLGRLRRRRYGSIGSNVVHDIVVVTAVAVMVVTVVVVVMMTGGDGIRVDMRSEVVSGGLATAVRVAEGR